MLNILKDLNKKSLVLVCLFVATLMLVGCSSEASKKEAELKKGFQIMLNGLQKSLPAQIDEYTLLEKAELTHDARITYTYTIQGLTDAEINEFKDTIYESVQKGQCAFPDIKAILEAGGEFEYIYNNMDGKKLIEFVITKDDCK